MYKLSKATYKNGILLLDEKIENLQNDGKVDVIIISRPEYSESKKRVFF